MPENLISESSVSYSPEQLEELIAFVGPVDLPTLASNYKSKPEKFRRQLAGYILLSACRGQSAEQICQSLKDHDIASAETTYPSCFRPGTTFNGFHRGS